MKEKQINVVCKKCNCWLSKELCIKDVNGKYTCKECFEEENKLQTKLES